MKNISNLVVEVGGAWGRAQTQEVSTHLTMGRETILGPPPVPSNLGTGEILTRWRPEQ